MIPMGDGCFSAHQCEPRMRGDDPAVDLTIMGTTL